jgi:hypothetical protein
VAVAVAGSAVSLVLLVAVALASTRRDAAGFAGLALGFAAVPWAAVWAVATRRRLVAVLALALAGIGFAALARESFPTIVPAATALGLAVAVAVRPPTDESAAPRESPQRHRPTRPRRNP